MLSKLSRRDLIVAASAGATAIALNEMGGLRTARAEGNPTIGSPGGSWGDGIREAFVDNPRLEATRNVKISYANAVDTVIASKVIGACGNPVYTLAAVGQSEGSLIGASGCAQPYDLNIVTNVKEVVPTAALPPMSGTKDPYWVSFVMMVLAPVWNTKHATKPTSYKDLWSSKYKGRVGVPAYGWKGIEFLHAVNKVFGGNEDNITPGIDAVAELVKKNNAIIIENTDHGMKAFTQEEIVVMPFWNGRAFALQANGVPVDIAYVPGTVQVGTAYTIAKGTQFADLANEIVKNSLNGEFQLHFAKKFGYPPTSRTVKLPPDMEKRVVSASELGNVVELDWTKLNKYRADYMERWNKQVLG
jgi:putative spermidine/putrescine transport system substrate-binding protein